MMMVMMMVMMMMMMMMMMVVMVVMVMMVVLMMVMMMMMMMMMMILFCCLFRTPSTKAGQSCSQVAAQACHGTHRHAMALFVTPWQAAACHGSQRHATALSDLAKQSGDDFEVALARQGGAATSCCVRPADMPLNCAACKRH